MKKLGIILLLLIAFPFSAIADFSIYKNKVKVKGEVVTRLENWNFFEPDGSFDNDYWYSFERSRISLEYDNKYLNVFLQGQDTYMFNLPDRAIAPPPQGKLGLGAIYFAHGKTKDYHSTFLKQAYIKLIHKPFTLKLGRFNYYDGLETLSGDPKIDWLKKVRISERLIGPFGWSAFTRSYDGGVITYDDSKANLTLMFSRPTQGGLENDAMDEIDDIELGSLALTLKKGVIPYSDTRLFYIYYRDNRGTKKTDNLPAGSLLDKGDIDIHTIGFHIASAYKVRETQALDFLLWGAIQQGDWGKLDQEAWALDGEIGYQFLNKPLKPWFRIGYFASSGDSNPQDGDHETFFQILPTARKYAFTPFYNLMNIEDLFGMIILKPNKKSLIRMDTHILKLNESNDKWYAGAGATKKRGVFGYAGRPSQGEDDLAKLFDFTLIYKLNKYLKSLVYYSHIFGDDIIEKTFRNDDADFFYVELKFSF
jgi:hypothetical protein